MDKLNAPLSDELLARYMAGTATAEETEQVREWLAQSPERAEELKAYRKLWEHSERIGQNRVAVDTDKAWQNLQKKIERRYSSTEDISPDSVIKPLLPSPKKHYGRWAAATVALLALTFGWLFFKQKKLEELVKVVTLSNSLEHILPDGTKVALNYNSTLSYSKNFSGATRSVTLTGEAFFEVTPDSQRPFIIEAKGTQIRVVGTTFNVKAYNPLVRVDVASGRVEVKKQHSKVVLRKGQGTEINKDSTFRNFTADLNRIGYHTKIYDFIGTPLSDAISILSEGYHADIQLRDKQIASCPITVRFEKESLDVTLAVIAETLNLKVKQVGTTYYLEGAHCQ